jgi:hypothetical protein
MCERMDGRSFARYLSLLDNLMLRHSPSQSLTEYVHFMRQTCDAYNETCEIIDGLVAIHPHSLGLMMQRGISRPATSVRPNNVASTLSTPTTSCP